MNEKNMNEKVISIIDDNFPFKSYRPRQKETIYDILKSFTNYDNVILESPVGTGKSVIAATVANFFKTCYYVTIQKFLMEQITNDFEWIIPLKGRNSYPCWFMNDYLKSNKSYYADKGKCIQTNKPYLKICADGQQCKYRNQLEIAMKAEQVLFNFSSFLHQRVYANKFMDPKKMLIVDECFHPRTSILTNKGRIPIGKLVNQKSADCVWSYNEKSGQLEKKKIIRYIKNKKKMTYKVLIGNKISYPTINHKFYCDGQFIPLSKLNVGDMIMSIDHATNISYQPILLIEPYKETITYNLEIKDNHNYIAGSALVSNCHNTEPQIMNFVEVVINGNDVDHKLPQFDEVSMYISYFKMINFTGMVAEKQVETRSRLKSIVGDTDDIDFHALDKEDAELAHKLVRDINKYEAIKRKYNNLLEYVSKIKCICDFDGNKNTVTIKPLDASFHTPELLLSSGKKRLFMSATVLDHEVFGKSIGLDMEKTKFIQVPHSFPVTNRLIYLDYAGPMDHRNKSKTMPKLIQKIEKLMAKHGDEKGIIHCQSFALLQTIRDGISAKNRNRLLDQTMFDNKDELLLHHANCANSVIIAPAMHEGLDLKDDLSRFQIICKIPYPDSRNDKQLEERTKENWNYYLWLVAIKLTQSVGRSIRSETDYASTYIIDESFDKFFNMCDEAGLLPDWFVESLVVN